MKKCLYTLAFTFITFTASPAIAQSENNPPPLRRVTLYKHGVGYFERQGKVTGDSQVGFLFDAAQMNDVLKSLVVLDLGKGKISSVTFDSTKPVEKRLEEFGIALDGSNEAGLTALLGQLKGARVEIRTGTAPTNGTIVGIEKRVKSQGAEKVEVQDLVMLSEGGELRSIALDQIRGIRLLDAKLREDLDQYLSILQSTIHKNLRKLTITANGQGERDLFVSYVVEAPIWKATYRVVLDPKSKPFLQGWALIDNVQDEDWTNVTLSLVSGAPVSFIQDLQQPLYKRRPVVGMPEDISVAPQIPQAAMSRSILNLVSASRGGVVEGTITDSRGAVIPSATIRLTQAGTGAEITTTANSEGEYRTIIENDTYAGEALTGRIKPSEKRFITYAVDLGCRVSVKEDREAQKAFLVEISNGEFRVHYKQTKTTVYSLNNLTDRAKTVYLEHPYNKNEKWQLVRTSKPVETTENFHRFKVVVTPSSTVAFSVSEELPDLNTFALSNLTTNNIELFIQSNYLTPQMKQALESITNLKSEMAVLARQIHEKQTEITTVTKDQERMRENLRALGKTEEEKQLVQRYVGKIAQGEDQLERLRQEEKRLKEDREKMQSQLDDKIRKLAMEHRLS